MRRKIMILLLTASVIMIVTGVVMGQNQNVMSKAIRICLECVGIG